MGTVGGRGRRHALKTEMRRGRSVDGGVEEMGLRRDILREAEERADGREARSGSSGWGVCCGVGAVWLGMKRG